MNEAVSRFFLLLSMLASLALAACSGPAEEPPLKGATLGGAFTLTDHNGRQVSERDFAGKYRIVYFGFAQCPDVCPTDLLHIGRGLSLFEKEDAGRAAKVQPIFITTDPERDRPAVLKPYVTAFHPRLIGLTGTPEQIADVAKKHGVYYAKGDRRPDGGYSVDHSRVVILFSPQGEPIALLPHEEGAEAIAAELERWVA
jgi:protein SCO1/2